MTLSSTPSPWMGEGGGEGARKAAVRSPPHPNPLPSPVALGRATGPRERGSKGCVGRIRHRTYDPEYLARAGRRNIARRFAATQPARNRKRRLRPTGAHRPKQNAGRQETAASDEVSRGGATDLGDRGDLPARPTLGGECGALRRWSWKPRRSLRADARKGAPVGSGKALAIGEDSDTFASNARRAPIE